MKPTTLFKKKLSLFIKISEILVENSGKCEENQRNSLYFLENLNLDKSLYKTKIEKLFIIQYSTLDKLFNDTTHISLRSAKIVWTKNTHMSI